MRVRPTRGRPAGAGRQPRGLDRRPRPSDEHAPAAAVVSPPGARPRGRRVGCFPIRSASFVSVLVDGVGRPRARAADRRLLPLERRLRVHDAGHPRERRPARARPRSSSTRPRTFASTDIDPGERFFYEVRNKVWLFTRSRGLNPFEKTVYGGADRCSAGRPPSSGRATAARCCAAWPAGSPAGSPPVRGRPTSYSPSRRPTASRGHG